MAKSDKEIISNEQKVKLTEESLKLFYEQFGSNDITKVVLFDVLFEELLKVNYNNIE